MTFSEMFYLVDSGEGRWIVKHQITNELAGSILRTSQGFVLRDDDSKLVGAFATIDQALRGLYALV